MLQQGKPVRLTAGLAELDAWAAGARQSQKNVLYKALFAVTDGTVYHRYDILQDAVNASEHFVLIREDLVLKFSYADGENFGILYIGPLESAPGLDLALDLA
ncbi:MAG TPA: DUF6235 family protein [Actinophytocola sp.]|uniref:DUF6235 family protein n=1 Tax=Actinophytocola sp. TaxID=1872138 RepID=UPI002DBD8ECC|nr:DUF6235 family protein [Actinophytocola sp.]HEU5475361.1 DUF6235 family protein [Actinophytocola sp.]